MNDTLNCCALRQLFCFACNSFSLYKMLLFNTNWDLSCVTHTERSHLWRIWTLFSFFSVFHNFSSYYYSQYIQAHNDQPIIKIIIKRKFFVSKILVLLYIDFFVVGGIFLNWWFGTKGIWWMIFVEHILMKGNPKKNLHCH